MGSILKGVTMSKPIYLYDAAGIFTGIGEADESPLEPGVWLIPAGATMLAPPDFSEKQAAVWTGADWALCEDHRGEVHYSTADGSTLTVSALGPLAEVAPGTTDIPPPAEMPADHRLVWKDTEWGFEILPPPTAVTMRQARLALLAAGKLATVNVAIATMPGDTGEAARVEWEYATSVDRNNPLIESMSQIAELSEPDLDDFFRTAAKL